MGQTFWSIPKTWRIELESPCRYSEVLHTTSIQCIITVSYSEKQKAQLLIIVIIYLQGVLELVSQTVRRDTSKNMRITYPLKCFFESKSVKVEKIIFVFFVNTSGTFCPIKSNFCKKVALLQKPLHNKKSQISKIFNKIKFNNYLQLLNN